ncbi:MAG: FAD-dependent oxidoreductase, partial [Acidithiobacillus sp.]
GVVIEIAGAVTKGMIGTGFLYTNKESITIGIGCLLSDFKKGHTAPYTLLEELKAHPAIQPLLQGSEMKEYAAHLIPEGGYKAIPQLYGDGWMLAGDSAGLVNAVHREGSNLAMTSGRLAAETIIALKEAGKSYNAANLARYKSALDESFVMKDLKKYKELPDILHGNPHFFGMYPKLLNRAAHTMLTVDGEDKHSKEKAIRGSFMQQRSLWGLMGDAYRMWRATR